MSSIKRDPRFEYFEQRRPSRLRRRLWKASALAALLITLVMWLTH
jgi:hypothetical protein